MTSVSAASGGMAAMLAKQQEMFNKTDTDQNGALSQSEFVSSRPSKMSEEAATKLYSKIDTEGTGSVTFDQLSAAKQAPESRMGGDAMGAMMGLRQQGGMPPMAGMGDPSSLYSDLDADSDAKLTESEFLAKAPGGEDDARAQELFSKIDSEGQGYVTEEQFTTFVTENAPKGPMGPPPGGMNMPSFTEETAA
ncbi:Ca2+-binding EF-hand superfamily protein [Rhizobium sp. SG_E_25_P2]|jgi:Ca2+-binding EF-hand superfamily protein|uniref:EF-hand domain-containing protein n=1 Tax=Rhizobium sp. SG_E_25_P2 TaxID=2879942 RepID=UPI002472F2F8|nr:EF-hand domain-containing protein [Rhizobium sp. SG_E_25_P2]MDH6265730.1 Ca2+-binding EF-hand superfamily protein [Rhizobium sp. SG_E_25_P2]